jgi:hypothetical protein
MRYTLLSMFVSTAFFVANVVLAQEPKPAEAATLSTTGIDPAVAKELKIIWKNALGSTMEITQVDIASGQIRGTYRSPSGTGGQGFPLIGWINHAAPVPGKDNVVVISFSVRWGQYGSVTAWNGFYKLIDNKPTIVGQWLLVRSNSDFVWDHTLTGLDTFHPSVQ